MEVLCHRATGAYSVRWGREDSNLRRLSRQVYSLLPLAARAHPPRTLENLSPPALTYGSKRPTLFNRQRYPWLRQIAGTLPELRTIPAATSCNLISRLSNSIASCTRKVPSLCLHDNRRLRRSLPATECR